MIVERIIEVPVAQYGSSQETHVSRKVHEQVSRKAPCGAKPARSEVPVVQYRQVPVPVAEAGPQLGASLGSFVPPGGPARRSSGQAP